MTSIGPPRRCARPTPSMTKMVWPFGCVCHAVRAPGVKWTLLAFRREASDGAATESMYTAPVNQSLGPGLVSTLFRVICIVAPLLGEDTLGRRRARRRPLNCARGATNAAGSVIRAEE